VPGSNFASTDQRPITIIAAKFVPGTDFAARSDHDPTKWIVALATSFHAFAMRSPLHRVVERVLRRPAHASRETFAMNPFSPSKIVDGSLDDR
jgi:hypothetical protein